MRFILAITMACLISAKAYAITEVAPHISVTPHVSVEPHVTPVEPHVTAPRSVSPEIHEAPPAPGGNFSLWYLFFGHPKSVAPTCDPQKDSDCQK